jgi:hypothetical protein
MNKYTQALYDLYIERSLHIPLSKEYIRLTILIEKKRSEKK